MPFSQYDMECGPKCRSKGHAQDLNAAVTRGSLKEIQAYFRLCHNAGCATDRFNRTALHVAASCGKIDVVQWLLSAKKVDPALKDEESGYTALHRAVFYGQIGVTRILLQGAPDLSVRDREGLGPLDIILRDRPANVTFSKKDQNEVYSWGDNSNLTLGHSVEQRRPVPEPIDTFRKLQLTVHQVVLCKYHSVFLTSCGKVLTCGHGQGGRLGHNDEQTCLVPRVVEGLEKEVCVQVSAARDHTVFLTEGGAVYTCGLNDCHQLGQFPPPPKSLSPKQMNSKIIKGKKVTGIYAGRFHTAVTTSQGGPDAIFTFGLNAGQLGHPKGEIYQSLPRLVAALNHPDFTIQRVACSDAAIVCMASQGDIYVLHEYQCRKIASKWHQTLKIEVSGGHLDHHADRDVLRESGGTQLTIALLSPVGNVFVWRESSQTITRCHWAIRRPLYITDFTLSQQLHMVLVTEDGEAFMAHYSQRKSPSQSNLKESGGGDSFAEMTLIDLLLKDDLEEFHVNRIPFIYRATSVAADKKGSNFVITQTPPNACLTDVPCVSGSTITSDLRVLLEEADPYDLIHDVLIKIGGESIPAHKYILAYRCEYFRKLFDNQPKDSDEKFEEIQLDDDVSPHLFRQLLLFIYTDSCDFLRIGARCDLPSVQYSKANNDIFDFEPHFDLQNSVPTETFSSQKKQNGKKEKSKPKKKNGLKLKGKGDGQKQSANARTPVKVLQDLAKKFGLKDLCKRLEYVNCVNGVIQSTGKSIPKPHIKFERKKLSSLYDVSISGEDGYVVQCHKCIAVARLEYFHSMMASGWIETSNTSALSLPIPGDILETVLDFLYIGDSPAIRGCTDIERLCNVLVMSDHLLITALKEMCEVALVTLLTLKNAADLLEFASMYNAVQLRSTCQQFICLNLATILEARGLDCLSDEVIGELTVYYRTMVPGMCRRQITPYDEGPSREFLEALGADFNGEDDDISISATCSSVKKKLKPKKKRNRSKSNSEEINTVSFNLPVFPKRAERQMSVSSETSVKSEDILDVTPEEVFTVSTASLATKNSERLPVGVPQSSSPWGAVSSPSQVSLTQHSPDVSLSVSMETHKDGTQKSQSSTPKKTMKISQKERKKLLANQNPGQSKTEISPSTKNAPNAWGDAAGPASSPVASPWSGVTRVVQSFRDLMLQEKDKSEPIHIPSSRGLTAPLASPTSPGAGSKLSWGLPTSTVKRGASVGVSSGPVSPSSPTENPWLSKSPPVTKSSLSFHEIVRDERQKQDNLVKNINKPLSLIQIEERAIQELLQHYKAEETYAEQITVERVTGATATPLWAVDRK